MADDAPLRLFEGYGIEIEYMIVSSGGLDVQPVADTLLGLVGGGDSGDVDRGDIAWSNELALHIVELKTNGPAPQLAGLGERFQANVAAIDELLAPLDARLLPTAMHPWMDPQTELRLWPHENNEVYQTFNRIFDCRGHGWANLQSTHINLPFSDDAEFGTLHAAIRLVLPLLPGLAASSPFAGGRASGLLDTRLDYYRRNSARVPSVSGSVVPEPIYTRKDYETGLLGRIYSDLSPYDPDGTIRREWVNARGAIARFDRMAIEIRTIDVQENPAVDIAVATAACAAVRCLTEQWWCASREQREFATRELAYLHQTAEKDADETVVEQRKFLECFGYPEKGRARLGDVWQHLVESVVAREPNYVECAPHLRRILQHGCLARRIRTAAGNAPDREALGEVYRRLADCLHDGRGFTP